MMLSGEVYTCMNIYVVYKHYMQICASNVVIKTLNSNSTSERIGADQFLIYAHLNEIANNTILCKRLGKSLDISQYLLFCLEIIFNIQHFQGKKK